jgi:hypothetical protein
MSVLLRVKAGHEIPAAYQTKFLEACKSGFSFSVANKSEGMKSLFYNPLPEGKKKGYDLAKSLQEVSTKFKDKNYVLVGYEYEVSPAERQPFPVLMDDKEIELLHVYISGDMARYMDPKKPVGPETQFMDAYFGSLIIDAYTEAGANLTKLMEKINSAEFRKPMIEHMEPKCTIMLLSKDDDFLRLKRKNDDYADFSWGEASQTLGYKEEEKPVEEKKEDPVADDDNIPAWRKARLAATPAAVPAPAATPPAKPEEEDEDDKDDEEAGEVDDTKSQAAKGATGPKVAQVDLDELAKGLDPKDGIWDPTTKSIKPPVHLGGRELRRHYGSHSTKGHLAYDLKNRQGIPVEDLQPGSHLYRLFNRIPEKTPVGSGSGKNTDPAVVATKDTLAATSKPQPLMTADQIEKTKKVVSSAFASPTLDSIQVQAIEGKYPKFSDRLDVKPEEMILWPQDRMFDVVQTGHKQAWMLILELQAWVLALKPDLVPKAVAPVAKEEEEDDDIPAWRKAKMKSQAA